MLSVHQYAAARRKRRRAVCSGPVQTVQVDPRLMALALDMAGHDPARLRVLSPTQVLVLNRPRRGTLV